MVKKIATSLDQLQHNLGIRKNLFKEEIKKNNIKLLDFDIFFSKYKFLAKIFYFMLPITGIIYRSFIYNLKVIDRTYCNKKLKKSKNKIFVINELKYRFLLAKIFFFIHRPDLIISVHGYFYSSAVISQVAIEKKVNFFILENTFDKKKIFYRDNYNFYKVQNLIKKKSLKNFSKIKYFNIKKFIDIYLQNIQLNKSNQHKSPLIKTLPKKLKDKKFHLIFMQVYNDINVINGIKKFKDPVNFLYSLLKQLKNKNIVIKLHPKEFNGSDIFGVPFNKVTYKLINSNAKLSNYIKQNKILIDYDNTLNTTELIKQSISCISLNSQALIESRLFNRPSILFSDNYYYQKKFFHLCSNIKDINAYVSKPNKSNKMFNYYLYTLINNIFINKTEVDLVKFIKNKI